MAGRIPQHFIDDLLTRIDIVEVIDNRVPLKKAGHEYKACCPFHNEKTPSFTVSQVKQFYHCFGCGEHGNAISFLMDYEHMDFVEAIEALAHGAGIEVQREAGTGQAPQAGNQAAYDLLERAARYYQQQLRDHPEAQRAIDYLNKRGLSDEVATRFGIGFAPPGWDNLTHSLGSDKKSQQQLLKAGLAIERNDGNGVYDRFRDRIQFPIHDRRGRTIGFGGRVINKDDTPKYLNSPETPVFHKGRELYGLYEVRKAMRKLERILVVEGYTDVLALAQFGINYAVATLGTATTHDHLEILFRTVPEVIFCFDGDRAGRQAAWRALENTLPVLRDGREARFLFLPEGEDPDSQVRKIGKDGFETALNQATPLSDFFFNHLSSEVDISNMDGRARLVELTRPYLAKLPDGIFREMMTERLAEIAQTDAVRLARRLEQSMERKTNTPGAATRPPPSASGQDSPVRKAVALLLHQPGLAGGIEQAALADQDELPGLVLLAELVRLIQQQPELNTGAILEHWRGRDEARHLHKLAQWEPLSGSMDLATELHGIIEQIKQQLTDIRINYLSSKERESHLDSAEKQEYVELLAKRHT